MNPEITSLFAALDRVATQVASPEEEEDSTKLRSVVQRFASSPEKLRLLTERYAGCRNASLEDSIAYVLNKSVFEFRPEDLLPVVLTFIGKLSSDWYGTLVLALSALTGAVGCSPGGASELTPIGGFLIRCLEHRSSHQLLVHAGACDALLAICDGRLISDVYASVDKTRLLEVLSRVRTEYASLGGFDQDRFTQEIAQLVQCIEEGLNDGSS